MANYEHCCECDCHTGKAGAGDDSLYAGDYGPLCEECYDALIKAAPTYKRQRDLLLTALKNFVKVADTLTPDMFSQTRTRALAAIGECEGKGDG